MGDPEEAPGSWLQFGAALAIVTAWGVNQWMEDLPVSHSLSISDFPTKFFKTPVKICFSHKELHFVFLIAVAKWAQLETIMLREMSESQRLDTTCLP